MAELTPIYAGVSHARIEELGRLQWPVEDTEHTGSSILYGDDFPIGRGKFMPVGT